MSRKRRNLVGMTFNNLTVVGQAGKNKSNHYMSVVRCTCGREWTVRDTSLVSGKAILCCAGKKIKHRMTNTRLFIIWQSMIGRCTNPNNTEYKNYGGRGILVCDEWRYDFLLFYEWANKNGYKDDLSIDRIDVNGNYEPSNCRWATAIDQARNKRNTVKIEYDGKLVTAKEVEEMTGIKSGTIMSRIRSGWSDQDATHTLVGSEKCYERSKNNAKKRSVSLTKQGEVISFESCSEASRYLGYNVGYLSTKSTRLKTNSFQVGEYYVELSDQCIKL